MFDPISIFYFMWILNSGLPDARLNVHDIIRDAENKAIIESVTLHEGV
jgi:hypothetical protein